MMTPIPSRVDDPKDAVLWSVLNSLEQVDQSPSSRLAFAQNIMFKIHASLDGPAFYEEIRQIKDILGVKTVEEEPITPPADHVPTSDVPREDTYLREL